MKLFQRLSTRAALRLFAMREELMPGRSHAFPPGFLGVYPQSRRVLAQANFAAVRGIKADALRKLAQLIATDPQNPAALTSFGALLNDIDAPDLLEDVFDILGGAARLEKEAATLPRGVLFVLLNLALLVRPEFGKSVVQSVYIDQILRPDLLAEPKGKPLFTWHIPKCGGTSINAFLAQHFYRSGMSVLPAYDCRALLTHLAAAHHGDMPFISSAHLPYSDFTTGFGRRFCQIAFLRDPFARAVSAWRQYAENPYIRLQVLPQHGAIWDFWPRGNLAQWAQRCPPMQVNKMTSSFAADLDLPAALRHAGEVTHLFDLKDSDQALPYLRDELGIPFEGRASKSLNASQKSIAYKPAEAEKLHEMIQPDQDFYRAISARMVSF